ncbi:MAG: hypothetical protein J6M10_10300 [Clostridia bacterium]|nr:hypothetical protein [Clostridia bacterium]
MKRVFVRGVSFRQAKRPAPMPQETGRLETSKLILYVSWAWFAVVCIFAMVMIAMEKESDTLTVLVTASAAEVATATGFYFWKARTENKLKLRAIYGAEIYNDAGIGDE